MVCVGEGGRPTWGGGWTRLDYSSGHVNVDVPLLRGGALYQGGAKDGVYFPVMNDGLYRLALRS